MARFDLENYRPVQERINEFLAQNTGGRILTNLMSLPDDYGTVVFKAEVYANPDDPRPVATGWAIETAGTSDRDGANFGSHLENAETSAIGRALANYGFAKNASDRPSREEMGKANRATPVVNAYPQSSASFSERPQAAPGTGITPPQIKFINQLAEEKGILDSVDYWANQWYGTNVESLDRRDASAMIDKLKDFVADRKPDDYAPGPFGPPPFEQAPSGATSSRNPVLVQPGSNAESGMTGGALAFWEKKIREASTTTMMDDILKAIEERFGERVGEPIIDLIRTKYEALEGRES